MLHHFVRHSSASARDCQRIRRAPMPPPLLLAFRDDNDDKKCKISRAALLLPFSKLLHTVQHHIAHIKKLRIVGYPKKTESADRKKATKAAQKIISKIICTKFGSQNRITLHNKRNMFMIFIVVVSPPSSSENIAKISK